MRPMTPPGFGGSFLGQQQVPGPEEEIPTPPVGSGLRVSVWDGKTDEVVQGAVVTAARLDGVPGSSKDTTGTIGTAILAFPDAPIGTSLLVKVSAKGYRTKEFQTRTVSRAEAETRDPVMGYMVDLEKPSGLLGLLVVAGAAGAVWWALS